MDNLARYDWIVFTSRSGVRFFASLMEERGLRAVPVPVRIAAVGPGTAQALARAGLAPQLVAGRSSALGLAETLRQQLQQPDAKLLDVRPEAQGGSQLAQALREAGACPDEVAFYRNVPAAAVAAVARDVRDGRYDAVVFSSPSTLARLLAAPPLPQQHEVRAALARARLVAIGTTTASALEREGLHAAAIARAPTDAAIARAVVDSCTERMV
jgi:uroporphyrinogen-III synthase